MRSPSFLPATLPFILHAVFPSSVVASVVHCIFPRPATTVGGAESAPARGATPEPGTLAKERKRDGSSWTAASAMCCREREGERDPGRDRERGQLVVWNRGKWPGQTPRAFVFCKQREVARNLHQTEKCGKRCCSLLGFFMSAPLSRINAHG